MFVLLIDHAVACAERRCLHLEHDPNFVGSVLDVALWSDMLDPFVDFLSNQDRRFISDNSELDVSRYLVDVFYPRLKSNLAC